MFPIITPQMLNLPDTVQPASLTRLPWPEGSIISARLMATDVPGTALLILGSYRLLAEVPPSTPMGEVWMQLITRDVPARFRVLTDAQALKLLAGMLESELVQNKRSENSPAHKSIDASSESAKPSSGQLPDWPHLNQTQRQDGRNPFPWYGDPSPDGNALLWYDQSDDQPRGILHRHIDHQTFILSGRLDLDKLGAIAFSLHGNIDNQTTDAASHALRLHLHAAKDCQIGALRPAFTDWLQQVNEAFPNLSGELEHGIPDGGPERMSERLA